MANNNHSNLAALHEKYDRLDLRGLWQRESRSAPELKPRIWRWAEMAPRSWKRLCTVCACPRTPTSASSASTCRDYRPARFSRPIK